jgi:putative flippase GtrA
MYFLVVLHNLFCFEDKSKAELLSFLNEVIVNNTLREIEIHFKLSRAA